MNFTYFEKIITNIIKENQLKLGYRKESMQLFYPLMSINKALGTNVDADEMQQLLTNHFIVDDGMLGNVKVNHKGDRFLLLIPEESCEYVHTMIPEKDFMRDFITTVARHGCTIDDLKKVFFSYSDKVHFEQVDNGEFDYLAYFTDGSIDDARYCIKDEGHHVIYHRYTPEDYEDFGF